MSSSDEPNGSGPTGDATPSDALSSRVSEFCATDPYNSTNFDVDCGEALLLELAHSADAAEFIDVALSLSSIYLELRSAIPPPTSSVRWNSIRAVLSSDPTFGATRQRRRRGGERSRTASCSDTRTVRLDLERARSLRKALEQTNAPESLAHVLSISATGAGDATVRRSHRRARAGTDPAKTRPGHARGVREHRRSVPRTLPAQPGRLRNEAGDRCPVTTSTGRLPRFDERSSSARRRRIPPVASAPFVGWRSPTPSGSARTSRSDAQELADAARAEAGELESALAAAGRGGQGWALFTGGSLRFTWTSTISSPILSRSTSSSRRSDPFASRRRERPPRSVDAERLGGLDGGPGPKLLAARYRGSATQGTWTKPSSCSMCP